MANSYLAFKFYYATKVEGNDDVIGDHVFANLISDILEDEQSKQFTFDCMRYSVGGYHILLKIRGGVGLLRSFQNENIIFHIDNYCRKHPHLVGLTNDLGDYSIKLYERLGLDDKKTNESGFYQLEFKEEQQELYENKEVYQCYLTFNDILTRAITNTIKEGISRQEARLFVRLLVFDLMEYSSLKTNEKYYLGYFARHQWVEFFEVNEDIQRACNDSYNRISQKFFNFLNNKKSHLDSLVAIPFNLRDVYLEVYNKSSKLLSDLIVRDEHKELNNHSALRLLGLIHLMHNRFGLDINQEIIFSQLLTGYWESKLDKDIAKQLKSSVSLNVSNFVSTIDPVKFST